MTPREARPRLRWALAVEFTLSVVHSPPPPFTLTFPERVSPMGYTVEDFQGTSLRVLASPERLLFNSKDICAVLHIWNRPEGSAEGADCMDLTTAVNLAISCESPLVEWLLERFGGYPSQTHVHPRTDGEWTNLR